MQEVFEKIIEKLKEDEKHTFDGCINKRFAIEIVKQEAEKYNGGWIPLSERLPEEGIPVLVQDYNGNYEIGICEKRKFNNYVIGIKSGDWWTWANNYIAWQPLPEPYNE